MRLFLVLMSGLVVAVPSWGQEPSGAVLDARIDALEQRFEDHRTDAREMRSARRTEAATEFENVRSEMSTRVWAFSIVIGLLLLFIGVGGSILTFLGRRWIADQIDERAGAAVSERLTAERCSASKASPSLTRPWRAEWWSWTSGSMRSLTR